MQKQLRRFLAPYADDLKQVSAKSGELKGYPLKTVVRIAFGGERCAAGKNQPEGGGGARGMPDRARPMQRSTPPLATRQRTPARARSAVPR